MIDLFAMRARQLRDLLAAAELDLKAGRFPAAAAKLAQARRQIDEALQVAGKVRV